METYEDLELPQGMFTWTTLHVERNGISTTIKIPGTYKRQSYKIFRHFALKKGCRIRKIDKRKGTDIRKELFGEKAAKAVDEIFEVAASNARVPSS